MSKKLINFPCPFPIKVMGAADESFEGTVVGIVNQYVTDLGEGAIVSKLSKNGHYISLTVTVNARSQEQLDDLYRALTKEPSILMVL